MERSRFEYIVLQVWHPTEYANDSNSQRRRRLQHAIPPPFCHHVPGGHFRALKKAWLEFVRDQKEKEGGKRYLPNTKQSPLRQKCGLLPSLAALNIRRGGSAAIVLDRGILPPPPISRPLLGNVAIRQTGGKQSWADLARELPSQDGLTRLEDQNLLGSRDLDHAYDWAPHIGMFADLRADFLGQRRRYRWYSKVAGRYARFTNGHLYIFVLVRR
ncbi:hypothetical protein V8E54_010440 [Elaphomyces granulatus]